MWKIIRRAKLVSIEIYSPINITVLVTCVSCHAAVPGFCSHSVCLVSAGMCVLWWPASLLGMVADSPRLYCHHRHCRGVPVHAQRTGGHTAERGQSGENLTQILTPPHTISLLSCSSPPHLALQCYCFFMVSHDNNYVIPIM